MKKLARALSARIKALREATGLSQQEIAERGELSVSLVGKLEQGKKADPRASTLLALAGALGVTPGTLLDDLFPDSQRSVASPEDSALAESAAPVQEESTAESNGTHKPATATKKKGKVSKKKKKKV